MDAKTSVLDAFTLEDVFSTTHVPMMLGDLDNASIIRGNASARDYYGYKELSGKHLSELVYAPYDKVSKRVQAARQGEKNLTFSSQHITNSGEIRNVRVIVQVKKTVDQTLFICLIIDEGCAKNQATVNDQEFPATKEEDVLQETEKTLIGDRKKQYMEKAQTVALKALKEERAKSKYVSEIENRALIQACFALTPVMPRALIAAKDMVRKTSLRDKVSEDQKFSLSEAPWQNLN